MTNSRLAVVIFCVIAVSGCAEARRQQQVGAMTLTPDAPGARQLEQRRYDTTDEAKMLSAGLSVMQDLGFSISETSSGIGLISGSKDRPSTRLRISIVMRPSADRLATIARVSFQAVSVSAFGNGIQAETISDPAVYRQFFERLSQAVFLEGHEI